MQMTVRDESDMIALAKRVAHWTHGGEVIELIGDVGAGKTTFTRGLARALGVLEPIQSPTFTISNRYMAPSGIELAHYDFYRLTDAGIMKDELAESIGNDTIVTVIEWGDIVADVLPTEKITVHIQAISETARTIEVTAPETLLEELA